MHDIFFHGKIAKSISLKKFVNRQIKINKWNQMDHQRNSQIMRLSMANREDKNRMTQIMRSSVLTSQNSRQLDGKDVARQLVKICNLTYFLLRFIIKDNSKI